MRLAIAGVTGAMGRRLVSAALERPEVDVVGGTVRAGSDAVGADLGTLAERAPIGIAASDDLEAATAGADGVLDFTAPAYSVAIARHCAARGLVHVNGTTGFSEAEDAAIAEAAATGRAAMVKSANMAFGVNLLAILVEEAARALPAEDFDLEIVEMHHRKKVDAPSGTALLLGRAAAAGRDVALADAAVYAREGHTGPRPTGAIGFATLRGGTVVGEHSVVLAGEGERVVLGHISEDRAIFARGAVKAALWAEGRPPGLYGMRDVLGLSG